MFSSRILTYSSLSGRLCSWMKPKACPNSCATTPFWKYWILVRDRLRINSDNFSKYAHSHASRSEGHLLTTHTTHSNVGRASAEMIYKNDILKHIRMSLGLLIFLVHLSTSLQGFSSKERNSTLENSEWGVRFLCLLLVLWNIIYNRSEFIQFHFKEFDLSNIFSRHATFKTYPPVG